MSDKKSYKELENQLSAILERVEDSTYDELDDLLKDYNEGKKIIDKLQKRIALAKNTIKKVK